jgi:hypothetical protein
MDGSVLVYEGGGIKVRSKGGGGGGKGGRREVGDGKVQLVMGRMFETKMSGPHGAGAESKYVEVIFVIDCCSVICRVCT